jgi:hypothetical protein
MSETIFRSIEVAEGQHLVLGEPIPTDVQQDLEADGPGRWLMRGGTFGGASSVEVDVDGSDAVTRMAFAYASGTDYGDMLQNFEAEIGAPDGQSGSAAAHDRQSVWEDAATRFVLAEQPDGAGAAVSSTLADRGGAAA